MPKSNYVFSFTAASLRINESVKVAKYVIENGISNLNQIKETGIVFGSAKTGTTDRQLREIRKRLEQLTQEQINLLGTGDLISQKQMAFLAICKLYSFIKDFTIDVVREKTLVYDYKINASDFNSFIQSKSHIHPELELFEESTFNKAKQVLFHILKQAGIIDNTSDKRIQPQLLSPLVARAIAEDDRSLLKIFMFSDRDINELQC